MNLNAVTARHNTHRLDDQKSHQPCRKGRKQKKFKSNVKFPKNIDPSVKTAINALTSAKQRNPQATPFKVYVLSTSKVKSQYGMFHSLNRPQNPTEMWFTHFGDTRALDEDSSQIFRFNLKDINSIKVSTPHNVPCQLLNRKKPPKKPWLVSMTDTSGESALGLLSIKKACAKNNAYQPITASVQVSPNDPSAVFSSTIGKIASLIKLDPRKAIKAYAKYSKALSSYFSTDIIGIIHEYAPTTGLWGKYFSELEHKKKMEPNNKESV